MTDPSRCVSAALAMTMYTWDEVDVPQVIIHPNLRDEFVDWVAEHGLCIKPVPTDPHDLPTFIVGMSKRANRLRGR